MIKFDFGLCSISGPFLKNNSNWKNFTQKCKFLDKYKCVDKSMWWLYKLQKNIEKIK